MKTRYDELVEQFKAFHDEHPEVWVLFKRFAFQMIGKGFKNYSAQAIICRIRWEADAGGDGTSQFKINNNFYPLYARWFMINHPEHDGFFRTRKQKSKDAPATHLPPLRPADFPEES